MEQAVTIKGTKSGIILVLDPSISFDSLSASIAEKFKENASFLGKHTFGLVIRGRSLSAEETDQVIDIIQNNSYLTIGCVIDDESSLEKGFKRALSSEPEQDTSVLEESILTPDGDLALIYRGNLRSGQDISSERSIIVLGDVKPGANVTSYGSIFILGELRGNAFAGAQGDRNAVIMALDLNPIQVRIADAIAISPDAEKGAKLKVKKKRILATNDNEPEVAYIENDHIVKTGYGASFLRQFYKI
ncbi:septum site-determining protein MinC [Butyrivibrio sp. AE2032]|uniref:septum site-determining protein MinC n=1 Tax=Butyrivibrio sp. AE2032 TaxID=1458463 RepID=UPI000689C022|nr:septum site-determining protein MinC [Butyrivibrio sp. AE2032]